MLKIDQKWLKDVLAPLAPADGSADCFSARSVENHGEVTGIVTDSRNLRAGEVFVALKGDHSDGHQYLQQAAESGASALIVEQKSGGFFNRAGSSVPVYEVSDTRDALAELARNLLRQFTGKTVVVAGSNGKTTTKEFLAAILRTRFQVISSPASFNNEIGVPLTVFSLLKQPCDILVLEMGTNHPGELARLVSIARPDAAVLTNIGPEHLEFFGDLNTVAEEEWTVPASLGLNGFAVLNADCDMSQSRARQLTCRVVSVGTQPDSHWLIDGIQATHTASSFRLTQKKSTQTSAGVRDSRWDIPMPGDHNIANAAQAIVLGKFFEVSDGEIQAGLRRVRKPSMRMETVSSGGVTLIKDCYNANPASVQAALRTLGGMTTSGHRVAIIGEMAEMGPALQEHIPGIIQCAAANHINYLVCVGDQLRQHVQTVGDSLPIILCVESKSESLEWLKANISCGDLVLFKGSRRAGMESVASEFLDHLENSLTKRFVER